MTAGVVKSAKFLWETWNIRTSIIASLFIQVSLTFTAPWRKSRRTLGIFLWLFYLSADAVALYSIGLITNGHASKSIESPDLLTFWASFLLVHLGGTDTITALALEDNELWLRHLLLFCSQVLSTIYLFWRTFHSNKLRLPTLLMFFDGCLKYLERTASLYQASRDNFRDSLQRGPDPGPNYVTLMEEYASMKEANIPVEIISNFKEPDYYGGDNPGTLGNNNNNRNNNINYTNIHGDIEIGLGGNDADKIELVNKAYEFFKSFRGLIADIMFTFEDRNKSRQFFLKASTTAQQAFEVVQIELNFIYDVFYTKVNVLRKQFLLTRVITFVIAVISLFLFILDDKQSNYHKVDVCITYVLLGGAIFMDVVTFIMFIISNWGVVALTKGTKKQNQCTKAILRWLLEHWPTRWSNKISQYDLLNYCLSPHPRLFCILWIKGLKDLITLILYVSEDNFSDNLRDAIFMELKIKASRAKEAEDAKKACEARGNLVFQEEKFLRDSKDLQPWTTDVNYNESLLLWHIATDLCISTSLSSSGGKLSDSCLKYRKYSKMLSDYMMYLLIMQPSMTSGVAGIAQTRFLDTCAEVEKFIQRKLSRKQGKIEKVKQYFKCLVFQLLRKFFKWLYSRVKNVIFCCFWCPKAEEKSGWESFDDRLKDLCTKIVEVRADWKPVKVKGDNSKSVLFDASRLAKKLSQLENDQWEVTFKVWVELLCYAASRCPSTAHVQQLRQGGELITLVWLVMTHLGLGEQFRISQGTGWAKIVVQERFSTKRSSSDIV